MFQTSPTASTPEGRRIDPCDRIVRLTISRMPPRRGGLDDFVARAARIQRRDRRPNRAELVARIRAELEAETYTTLDKLDIVADGILRDLARM
jgi:hypothetical protein